MLIPSEVQQWADYWYACAEVWRVKGPRAYQSFPQQPYKCGIFPFLKEKNELPPKEPIAGFLSHAELGMLCEFTLLGLM